MSYIFAVAIFLISASQASTVKLIARANLEDGYQLPPASFIDNVSPAINDRGSVAFKVLSFLDGQSGVVIVPAGSADSKLVYATSPELYLSDVSINQDDKVYFSEFSETGPVGVYRYDNGQLDKLLSVDDLFDFSAVGMPVASLSGFCLRSTRGSDARASREVHCSSGNGINKIFGEGQIVQKQDRASYLFTSSHNSRGDFAAKIRLGGRGEFAEERPDVIALVTKEGVHVLAHDIHSDETSMFAKFNNSVSLNNEGEVAFIGTTVNGRDCVAVASVNAVIVKVCEGDHGVKKIEYFSPQLNDKGTVAFRAFDEEGKRKIFVMKKGKDKPQKLFGEDDLVPIDLGTARILYREGFPGLSGNIGINNNDEIVFHALLSSEDYETGLGAGIFVVKD